MPRHHQEERRPGHGGQGGGQGGIPDGLLLGLLGFLLGLTLLVWTATGLAGLFAHGGWPRGVTFVRTPMAMRELASAPHDLPGAWPETPPGELSGYGLFWGLLISQLMVLTVLTVFVLGVVARYRVVRARRKEQERYEGYEGDARDTRDARDAVPRQAPAPVHEPALEHTLEHAPPAHDTLGKNPPQRPSPVPAPASAPDPIPVPTAVPTAVPTPVPAPAPLPVPAPRVRYGDPATRRPVAVQAVLDAVGPALVVTSAPAVWAETKDARAKLGPVLVYDPGHLCDTPDRLHWSPTAGCEDPLTAAARATALLSPVRPHALLDAAMADTAETLLRCWLHAAAVDARPVKQVLRWAQGGGAQEAVRILRTHPKAASGLAGLLESALTGHPERREVAQQLTARALSALSSVHIRNACTPNRTDALALDSFVSEGGTLYVVGESIEDPRARPGAMPLLTALTSSVVEHGRRMAARSSDGRLDPPMSLVLDDVAAVAPFPRVPELLTTGQDRGMPTLALLRSRQQGKDRWPHEELPDAP
ncbi:type IV secretory system conjugative DNA transfer family protein [Streptomyces sp. JV176]|uniref:type IV secretory system conjugative DNA transfer family protein n=1 Tax=Streptomyces sp. JV176 TaxID=858630 RepID=UPI002E798211|nr:type IV secretory system conjugative DNA transfer family protein [Streptomyces sp. JV176]MEE1800311.1 type IV secretory system conjugative DNA transfer family protein [Streptomyces sp. JV176]